MIRTKDFLPFVRLFENAACAEMDDPDYFFPEGKAEEAERLPNLRIICGACMDRKECLEYAIKEEIPHGIWGGKTPSERGRPCSEIRNRSARSASSDFAIKESRQTKSPEK
jgi:WhiB family transcriptional regulator, redox-sensing transcriptional regulator